jgi:peptidoglycan hydrolase-like protein with peptidoglycan-binding domain
VDAATLAKLDEKVLAVDHPKAKATDAARLDCARFQGDADYAAIAAGTKTLAQGARGPAVEKLQWSMLTLGLAVGGDRADGQFGPGTAGGVRALQKQAGLPETGKVDAATLHKLDEALAKRISELNALATAPEEKPVRYRVVTDLVKNRVYVLERGTDRPVASYLTSPGTAEFPTRGEKFTLQGTTVMGFWRPPSSDWASGLEPVPPGLDNPMGVCKLSFGRYAQYFHGIPKAAESALGRPASHGCLRMSGMNVLEFHERYAGPGTDVTLTRDRAQSEALARKFADAGVADRPILAGREYLGGYLYGEQGRNEKLEANGSITVGGRGG